MSEKKEKKLKEKDGKFDKMKKHEEDLIKQIDEANVQIEQWKNKYYMAYADVENARKTNDRNYAEAMKYRAASFIEQLIPVLDAFQIALDMQVSDEKVKQYLIGFDHIHKQIIEVMKNEGVVEINPKFDEDFDYKTMHAMDTIIDEGPPNKVKKVLARGYKLKDRIIRAAMVIVSKQQEKTNIDAKDEQVKSSVSHDA